MSASASTAKPPVQSSNKREGTNDLLERLRCDAAFAKVDLDQLANPSQLVGRAPEQVDEFLAEVVAPIRERYVDRRAESEELRV